MTYLSCFNFPWTCLNCGSCATNRQQQRYSLFSFGSCPYRNNILPSIGKIFPTPLRKNCSFSIRFICKILDLFKVPPCQTSLLCPNLLNLNPNLLFLKSLQSSPYPRASSSLKTSSSKTWLLALWCSTKTGSCSCNVAQVNAPFQTFG